MKIQPSTNQNQFDIAFQLMHERVKDLLISFTIKSLVPDPLDWKQKGFPVLGLKRKPLCSQPCEKLNF